ncbi:hypothetical protein DICVIV_00729 [Dictyocaulus viviparus]|uniref:Uncharacterized protein n=1 Tax=Dictyocaulus viviparus TaxID=29172 RepID=A0A0D8YAK6_DICVI|nr:hypothetical protein DICVIV_00729 [Dictyocaulus viviparus]
MFGLLIYDYENFIGADGFGSVTFSIAKKNQGCLICGSPGIPNGIDDDCMSTDEAYLIHKTYDKKCIEDVRIKKTFSFTTDTFNGCVDMNGEDRWLTDNETERQQKKKHNNQLYGNKLPGWIVANSDMYLINRRGDRRRESEVV